VRFVIVVVMWSDKQRVTIRATL